MTDLQELLAAAERETDEQSRCWQRMTFAVLRGAFAAEIKNCRPTLHNPYMDNLYRWAWYTGFDLGRRIDAAAAKAERLEMENRELLDILKEVPSFEDRCRCEACGARLELKRRYVKLSDGKEYPADDHVHPEGSRCWCARRDAALAGGA